MQHSAMDGVVLSCVSASGIFLIPLPLVNRRGIMACAQLEHEQIYPQPGLRAIASTRLFSGGVIQGPISGKLGRAAQRIGVECDSSPCSVTWVLGELRTGAGAGSAVRSSVSWAA